MAHTDNVDRVNVTFPILKMEETSDGDLIVYGKATDATIDSDDQIVDATWSAKALEEWLKSGANIRVQHSPYLYPAGKGLEVHTSDDGHYVKALVVEPTAKQLVKKGVLQAYSVGIGRPKIVRDTAAKGGRIVDGKLIEISLVDRPANANCGFTIAKSAEGTVVDTAEVFGDIAAALAAVESKVDTAIEETTKQSDTAFVDSTKSELLETTVKMSPAQVSEYLDARTKFLDSMPEDSKSEEFGLWKSEKDLLFSGSAEARRRWVYKKDVDPGVGGGVDRDKLSDEDFAGPNRTYPIVTPSDVSDAASLVGHADNPDEVKRNIVAIANRKGADFVAALPDSWKTGDDNSSKGSVSADETTVETAEVEKGAKDCPKCGKGYDADAKTRNCENCGAALPKADADGDDDGDKSNKGIGEAIGDTDFDVDGNNSDGDIKPDKLDNRAGSGLQSGKTPADALSRGDNGMKSEDSEPLPYALKRLHDVTCGVYSDEVLRDEYATLKSWADAVNVDAVREHFGDELAEVAESVKASDPDLLADARAGLHKSFTQDYPNTTCTPGNITPGQFRRGFLSAGHYRQNASGKDSGARIPDGNRTIDAGQFDRGYLDAGHADESPAANKGVKETASANFTRNQLQSIHDHICERRPEVCAWQPAKDVDNKADSTLTPVTNVNIPSFPSKGAEADYFKALAEEAFAAKFAAAEEEIATLKAQVAELGAQPDPAMAPVRGVVAKAASAGKAAPVEKASSVEIVEPSYEEKLVAYAERQRFSGDPLERKRAEDVLKKYRKIAD